MFDVPTSSTPGIRTNRPNGAIIDFLYNHPSLKLGGPAGFVSERSDHQKIFGIHNIAKDRTYPIHDVEFTAIRGPHGTIPIRVLYPESGEDWRRRGEAAALIYFHGGGYTIGSVDEFENGLRLVAEGSGCQIYCVEYRLAPEYRYPVQLDEYDAVIDWLQGEEGKRRGIRADRLAGGGDSAGGNLTAAICLRRRDQGKKPLAAQILLYPEARLPFDTLAAKENNTGYYLQANGIFGFADSYMARPSRPNAGPTPLDPYVSPGMQPAKELGNQPKALVVTNGFDPLRDVGIEYAEKLKQAGVDVTWVHFDDMTHGFLQMTPWSHGAGVAARTMARAVGDVIYGKDLGNGNLSR
ncbi:alpha/beta hydrolase fold-domain-containing protein [Podospora fimiseda]|uniref:Alpha/beta hydrolase fold-domain-containing protein n=1 Tax=Podospora fimiseda TaxID=252190 RepID=A0AAN7BFC3_9PEZI|nr:alpha/beta hydrolase fold-domain-containing protein [Podospora fimiseda]